MSDESSLDRRTVLRSIGASAGVAGVSGVASASDDEVDGALVDRMDDSELVRSLLDDVDTATTEGAVGTYRLKRSAAVAAREYAAGRLVYAESSDGTPEAMFLVDDVDAVTAYDDIPAGTTPVLFATDRGTELRRLATEAERAAVEAVLGVEGRETVVYTGDGIDGFRVDVVPDDPEADRARRYEVTPADGGSLDTTAETVEPFSDRDEVSTDDLLDDPEAACDDCCPTCISCITSIGTCARCYFVCAGSPTGVGAVLCAACLKIFCELGGTFSCTFCADCLSEYI